MGYMLKCKKFNKNDVLYKTTTPHICQNMNIVLSEESQEHHGIFLERKDTRPCIKDGCLRPAATLFSSHFFFSPPNRPVLDYDSVFRSPDPRRDEEN